MPMKLVLATDANGRFFDLLDDLSDVRVVRAYDEEALRRELVDADGVYGWPSAEALAGARRLRWLQSPSAGVERLWSLPELQRSDVVVTNARGAHAPNMAEHVFGLVLAFSRGILVARTFQEERRWEARLAREFCYELAGSTIGIIGYGNIGRQVARRAHAFDMRVVAVDAQPRPRAVDDPAAELSGLDGLPDLLASSDVVVVCAASTPRARRMIGRRELQRMRPTAGLVVISRGALVDHEALAEALAERWIAWAALDATEPEPLPSESPLWGLENCLITPHSSGYSLQKERRVIELLRENTRRLAAGEPLLNVVDKAKGY